VRLPGIKEDAFGGRGFTGINVRDDANIPDSFERILPRHSSCQAVEILDVVAGR